MKRLFPETDRLPPDSYLRIPLVRAAIEDSRFDRIPRRIDCGWQYAGVLPKAVTGFDPTRSTYFYGARSAFAEWLRDPVKRSREFNREDRLTREVLFFAHDYLHSWCYELVTSRWPALRAHRQSRNAHSFDLDVFVHLVSEAVATVGLDYWYLSTVDLNEVVDIGTRVFPLTTTYVDRELPEIQKYFPRFDPRTPSFLGHMIRFYCSGEFPGFNAQAMNRSPILHALMNHEVGYGETQRKYVRSWLAYLRDDEIPTDEESLRSALLIDESWFAKVVPFLETHLWAWIREGVLPPVTPATRGMARKEPGVQGTVSRRLPIDFRFTNIERIGDAMGSTHSVEPESQAFLAYQLVSGFEFGSVDSATISAISKALKLGDFDLVKILLRGAKRVRATNINEPQNLLFLN